MTARISLNEEKTGGHRPDVSKIGIEQWLRPWTSLNCKQWDLREDLLLRQGNSPPKLGGVAARIKDSQNRAQTGRSVQLPPRNRCASRKSV